MKYKLIICLTLLLCLTSLYGCWEKTLEKADEAIRRPINNLTDPNGWLKDLNEQYAPKQEEGNMNDVVWIEEQCAEEVECINSDPTFVN